MKAGAAGAAPPPAAGRRSTRLQKLDRGAGDNASFQQVELRHIAMTSSSVSCAGVTQGDRVAAAKMRARPWHRRVAAAAATRSCIARNETGRLWQRCTSWHHARKTNRWGNCTAATSLRDKRRPRSSCCMKSPCRLQKTRPLHTARTAQRLVWRSCPLCTHKERPCLAAGSSCLPCTACTWRCWRRQWRGNSCPGHMARARSMTRCSCWVCRIACRTLQPLVRTSSSRFGKCSRQRSDACRSRYQRNNSSRGWRCTAGCSRWRRWGRGSSARGQTRWRTCPPRSTRTRLGRRERWLCPGRRGRSQCCRRRRSGRRDTKSGSQQRWSGRCC